MATAMANVHAAVASIAVRQPKEATASESGTPARTPPQLPTSSATPVTVANRLAANQCPASFMQVTNATPTAAPTSRRPAVAIHMRSASPNVSVPTAASNAAAAPRRLGPMPSARRPLGICITV